MIQPSVTILDYGMCNLLNVARAFEFCGANVVVTENPKEVGNSSRLVVPGVGAFRDSMKEVNERGLGTVLSDFARSGKPMFGICVGMQMLFDSSEEFGDYAGLGILPGRVTALPVKSIDGNALKVPHIGWNHIVEPESGRDWVGTLLEPIAGTNPAVYFVHSFSAVPSETTVRLADCMYGGHRICAAVQHENLMASQFHPERSGEIGLAIIRRFIAC